MKHVTPPRGEPLGELESNLAIQQAERAEALQRLRGLRKEAGDEIDRLLAFLDASDLDPDLETTNDEELDEADLEPSLGSFDRMTNQTKSWTGGTNDQYTIDREEDDCDHEESDPAEHGGDDEPSLGWTIDGHCEGFDDREADGETKGSGR